MLDPIDESTPAADSGSSCKHKPKTANDHATIDQAELVRALQVLQEAPVLIRFLADLYAARHHLESSIERERAWSAFFEENDT